jgi:hypothetical protein
MLTRTGTKDNPDDDPINGNNNVASMLDRSSGTRPLMMGLEIRAPKSRLSPDPFPAYKIEDHSLQEVTAGKPFPRGAPAAPEFAPAFPAPPPAADGAATDPAQWAAVFAAWTAATEEGRQQPFLDGWAGAFGWEGLGGLGGLPARLQDRERFDRVYVAAPMLSVA